MLCSETLIRVRYGETDKMGYLYYGHYPEYFEVARTELIRKFGISYRDIEDKGMLMPVRSLKIDYHLPARYDELLTVRACLQTLPAARLDIAYEIRNEKSQLICTGHTFLGFVDGVSGRPRRAPAYFLDAVKPYFGMPS